MSKISLVFRMLVFCILLIQNAALGQSFMANVPARQSINLNGDWQALIDWYDRGESKRIFLDKAPVSNSDFNEYSFSDFRLSVPGDWNSQGTKLDYYEGKVWYKKEFNYIPEPNSRSFIHFGAANYKSDVYLNGDLIGSHEGGFTPFQFEITDKVKSGSNKLIVSVDNRRSSDGIPALAFDWWNYGGITRDVNLITTPKNYIQDYFIQLKKGSLNTIEGWVKLSGSTTAEEVTIRIPEAKISKQVVTDINGYGSFSVKADLDLWSPDKPKLYAVQISSLNDNVKELIGFRSIETRGNEILLNGKPVFLKGISFHEEIPQRKGRATSETDAIQLLTWAKDLGCNFVRLAHYPQNEYILRKADEMGLMVWEEVPIWQGIDFKNPVILKKAGNMLNEMITRDKNRCGVIVWSLSNETRPSETRNKVLSELALSTRKLDPTRLISSAFDHFTYQGNKIIIDDPLSEYLDIIAANKYMGWYSPWVAEPGNMIWESKFNKPFIISEFGAEAVYGVHGAGDKANLWTEEYQEKVIKDNLRMIKNIPFVRGVCPWLLADFRSPFRMNVPFQNGWNRKGLLSDRGERKKAWFVIHDFYTDTDLTK